MKTSYESVNLSDFFLGACRFKGSNVLEFLETVSYIPSIPTPLDAMPFLYIFILSSSISLLVGVG